MDELRAALAQAQVAGKIVNIFFRDDDVDEDETSLRRLLNIFTARRVPIVLGVIPAHLTENGIKLLNQFSSVVEIVQHGWQHKNHETTARKCEFGVSRTLAEQYADIAHGQARLNQAFGENWFPAFIPPWNRCTNETHEALNQLGFCVLSILRGKNTEGDFRGQKIPVTLDIYEWRDSAKCKAEAEILDELAWQITQDFPIGIMLHHKVMSDEAFTIIEKLLDELQRFSNVRFQTLRAVAENTPLAHADGTDTNELITGGGELTGGGERN